MAIFKINDDVKLVNFPGMPEASIQVIMPDSKDSDNPEYLVIMIHQNTTMELYVRESDIISAQDNTIDIRVLPPQIISGNENSDVFKRARILTCTDKNLTPVPVMDIAITWSGDIVVTVINDILSRVVSPDTITECTDILTRLYMYLDNYEDDKLKPNTNKKCIALKNKARELFRMKNMRKASMMAAEYIKSHNKVANCSRKCATRIVDRAYDLGIADKTDEESIDQIWMQATHDILNNCREI